MWFLPIFMYWDGCVKANLVYSPWLVNFQLETCFEIYLTMHYYAHKHFQYTWKSAKIPIPSTCRATASSKQTLQAHHWGPSFFCFSECYKTDQQLEQCQVSRTKGCFTKWRGDRTPAHREIGTKRTLTTCDTKTKSTAVFTWTRARKMLKLCLYASI